MENNVVRAGCPLIANGQGEPPEEDREEGMRIRLQLFASDPVDISRIVGNDKAIFRTAGSDSAEGGDVEETETEGEDAEEVSDEPILFPRLMVTDQNLPQTGIGEMVVRDEDGNLLTVTVDKEGEVTEQPFMIGEDNIEDGSISASKLAEGSITAREVDLGNLFSDSPLLNQLVAANMDTEELFLNDLFVEKFKAGSIEAVTAKINEITAGNITTDTLYAAMADIVKLRIDEAVAGTVITDNLRAALAAITQAEISTANINTANIDWAQITTLAAEMASIWQANITTANVAQANIDWAEVNTLVTEIARIAEARITEADIDWANIQRLEAAIAAITSATIEHADINFANIKDFVGGTAIIERAVNGKLYVADLAVTEANMMSLTVGELIVKGVDGCFYAVSIDEDGQIVTTKKEVTGRDVEDNSIPGGKLLTNTITARELNVDEIFANEALIGAITSANINVAELFASGALIGKITTDHISSNFGEMLDLSSNESITLKVQSIYTAMDGVVKEVDVEYYLSTSPTILSGGSWQTTAPAWVDGKYMWSRNKVKLVSGATSYRPSENGTCIAGATGGVGADGAPGRGIASVTEEYYLSASKVDQIGAEWVTDPPQWSPNKYLWSRSKIEYVNPYGIDYTTAVCDSSWEAVNEVKVGSVNLISESQECTMTAVDDNDLYWEAADELEPGVAYVLSVREIIKNAGTAAGVTWELVDTATSFVAHTGILDFTYGRQTKRFKVPDEVVGVTREWALRLYCGLKGSTNGVSVTYHKAQLEEGTIATTWKPSPNDLASQISETANAITEMDEGMADRVDELIRAMGLEGKFANRQDFLDWVGDVEQLQATLTQKEASWEYAFGEIAKHGDEISKYVSKIVLGSDPGGQNPYIDMSTSEDAVRMRLTNSRLSFVVGSKQNPNELAYFSDSKLFVNQLEIVEQFSIGVAANGFLDIVTTPTGVGFKWRTA